MCVICSARTRLKKKFLLETTHPSIRERPSDANHFWTLCFPPLGREDTFQVSTAMCNSGDQKWFWSAKVWKNNTSCLTSILGQKLDVQFLYQSVGPLVSMKRETEAHSLKGSSGMLPSRCHNLMLQKPWPQPRSDIRGSHIHLTTLLPHLSPE